MTQYCELKLTNIRVLWDEHYCVGVIKSVSSTFSPSEDSTGVILPGTFRLSFISCGLTIHVLSITGAFSGRSLCKTALDCFPGNSSS
ncbi:hypothetical protein TNCV_1490011 [Trichonephila clavipes]|nr:hypothetical protein TNCV_1490011 [Trichonephila clavipes]